MWTWLLVKCPAVCGVANSRVYQELCKLNVHSAAAQDCGLRQVSLPTHSSHSPSNPKTRLNHQRTWKIIKTHTIFFSCLTELQSFMRSKHLLNDLSIYISSIFSVYQPYLLITCVFRPYFLITCVFQSYIYNNQTCPTIKLKNVFLYIFPYENLAGIKLLY